MDKQLEKFINWVNAEMAEINAATDSIYESLADRDDKLVTKSVITLQKKIATLAERYQAKKPV